MKFVLVAILVLLSVVSVDGQASLSFGNATPNAPGVSLTAVNRNGQLVVTVLWAFQASQCEILQRTDETINSRARIVTWSFQPSRCELLSRVDETIHERVKFVSKTSVCTHQDLCSQSTSVITGITCDEFMKVLN